MSFSIPISNFNGNKPFLKTTNFLPIYPISHYSRHKGFILFILKQKFVKRHIKEGQMMQSEL